MQWTGIGRALTETYPAIYAGAGCGTSGRKILQYKCTCIAHAYKSMHMLFLSFLPRYACDRAVSNRNAWRALRQGRLERLIFQVPCVVDPSQCFAFCCHLTSPCIAPPVLPSLIRLRPNGREPKRAACTAQGRVVCSLIKEV